MAKSLHRIVRNAAIKRNIFGESRPRKRAILKFTDKIGLVYFGYVNQYDDTHKVVHGFTISSSHRDDSYSVGTISDYDVTVVDRSDAIWQKDESVLVYKWLIMSFRLKTNQTIPHFFIKAKNHNEKHYDTIFTEYPSLSAVQMGTLEKYPDEFINRFEVYSKPADFIQTQRLIPPMIARVFAAHFWPFSVECGDNQLYIYSNSDEINERLLETMLENGLWLADHLDLQIENI